MRHLLGLLIATLVLVAFTVTSASAASEAIGRVLALKGEAFAQYQGVGQRTKVAKGDPVYVNDRLSTGSDSKVKLLLNDGSIVTMSPGTELVLSGFMLDTAADTRKSMIKLDKGTIRSLVSKVFKGSGSSFEVHTRTAITGSKGTSNIVSQLEGGGHDTLAVGMDSQTFARNSDPNIPGEQILSGGMGCYIDEGLPPGTPFMVPTDIFTPLYDSTDLTDNELDQLKSEMNDTLDNPTPAPDTNGNGLPPTIPATNLPTGNADVLPQVPTNLEMHHMIPSP